MLLNAMLCSTSQYICSCLICARLGIVLGSTLTELRERSSVKVGKDYHFSRGWSVKGPEEVMLQLRAKWWIERVPDRAHMYKGLDVDKGLVCSTNSKEAIVPEVSVSEGVNGQ